jgi:hypothetical protein
MAGMQMKSMLRTAGLSLLLLFAHGVFAQDSARVESLIAEMQVKESYQDSVSVCLEKAEQRDVTVDVAKTPGLLGGILPSDKDWPEAKGLYIRMLKAGCAYDTRQPVAAFTRSLDESLSPSDAEALIAFYRTDLGRKFVQASRAANMAAYRANAPLPEADGAYDAFATALQALLARRKPEPTVSEGPRVVKAMTSMGAAMALSDRMMKGITAGHIREAVELGLPHSTIPDEQGESLIKQIEQQKSIQDVRYGPSTGYELVRNDTIQDSLIRAIFLHRFERHAVVWQFVWYRGKEGWVLSGLKYTDDLPQLFG